MYYYIFDLKKCKKRSQIEEIKTYLGSLGISGEFTYPTAIQGIEELVDSALAKKYTTIVAIGDDEIANVIASKLLGRKEALGIIPLDAPKNLCQLVGVNTWKEACESLRYRKINEIHLGQTASGSTFLTYVSLDIIFPIEVTLEFRDFMVRSKVKNLAVANYYPGISKRKPDHLDVLLTSHNPNEDSIIGKIASLFNKPATGKEINFSLFRARSLRIFTKTPIGLNSEDHMLAKTPQLLESTDEKIRLITARNSILTQP